jgi:hypothetical protein
MRIVGDIPHSYCKITIFQTTNRYAVKFEQDGFEQTYKFRIGDAINGLPDVRKVMTEAVIEQIIEQFKAMAAIKKTAFDSFVANALNEFEDIF